jgi:hypothetical protein
MNFITNIDELKQFKSRDKIPLKCEICNQIFYRTKNRVLDNFSRWQKLISICSRKCLGTKHKGEVLNLICKQCNNPIIRRKCEQKNFKFTFCSSSCNATYWNINKTWGTRRSKLEIWIEKQLTNLYPLLEIKYNNRMDINAELDIYIPSLKIAFELNGIFHYEPIYGEKRLSIIKNNDNRKFQACLEREIELCIIDTNTQKYFKETTSKKFLDIITTIINKKLAVPTGAAPEPR